MRNEKFLKAGVVAFILFIVFSWVVSKGYLSNLDLALTAAFQNLIPGVFVTPFSVFSILGSFEVTILILIVLLFLVKRVNKIGIIILFGLIALIELIGKTYIAQLPPPKEFSLTNLHFGFPSGGVTYELFAYPSGHAARTAFISGFIIFTILFSDKITQTQKKLVITAVLIFDFIMFLSRVYLGEHWLSDVVGGALLGFSLALFTSYLLSLKSSK